MNEVNTIQSAGETEAGNAEVHPARDSRTRATNVAGMAGTQPAIPSSPRHSKPFYSLRKPESPHAAEKYSAKALVHFRLNHYRLRFAFIMASAASDVVSMFKDNPREYIAPWPSDLI